MDVSVFEAIIKEQIERSQKVLIGKAEEYAKGGDRLHNFRVASQLMGVSIEQAIAGMMTKHTVSIYDMCLSDRNYTMEMWNEKITDNINYLLILRAAVESHINIYSDDGVVMSVRGDGNHVND